MDTSSIPSTRSARGFAGQSAEYRKLRDELLEAEIALKDQRERVAELRRRLPLGAPLPEDYVFEEGPADLEDDWTDGIREVRLSELFAPGRDSLIVIHLMWAEENERPCPMCNMWADGYDAVAPHVSARANYVLVAKKNVRELRRWARGRGWRHIRLLSSGGSDFNADYGVEVEELGQLPSVSVFRRREDGSIHHSYTIEASLSPTHHRGIDLFSPVWNLLDLLPEGRGDFLPSHVYS